MKRFSDDDMAIVMEHIRLHYTDGGIRGVSANCPVRVDRSTLYTIVRRMGLQRRAVQRQRADMRHEMIALRIEVMRRIQKTAAENGCPYYSPTETEFERECEKEMQRRAESKCHAKQR